jgi:predicted ester cyclase
MSEENKALVRRYYEEIMGDMSGIEEIVTADFVDHHHPPGLPHGPEGVRQFYGDILGSVFSDMQIEHDFMLAEGDKVACYYALRAKHTGDFAGIPAKGNEILCPAITTFRIEGGKVAEVWEIYDSGDLLQQMQAD